MKKTKVLTLTIALLMLASSGLTGCSKKAATNTAEETKVNSNVNLTGLPLVKNKETLKVLTIIDPTMNKKASVKDSGLFKELIDKTNVDFQFIEIADTAWKEKKNLIVASNDLPDVYMGTGILDDIDLLNYSSQKLIVPIDKFSDKYAPNLNKMLKEYPDIKKAVTAEDGHIYSFPSMDDGIVSTTSDISYINKVWLDKLGLKMPTTMDELTNVLKAFRDNDPNGNGKKDEIPMTSVKPNYYNDWFGAFGSVDADNALTSAVPVHLGMKNGKAIYTAIQPEFKDGIAFFANLYKEGLLDKETFTQDVKVFNAKTNTAPPPAGTTAPDKTVGVFKAWRVDLADKDYAVLPPLKGPKGLSAYPERYNGLLARGSYIITSACKNPELAMRFGDLLVDDDYALQISLKYKIGTHLSSTPGADGKLTITKVPNYNDPADDNFFLGNKSRVYNVTRSNAARMPIPAHMALKQTADKVYKDSYPKEYYPNVFFTAKESERIQALNLEISNFVDQRYAKWITSGGVETEWDDYVKKLNDMGLPELMKIYQTALDRYNSAK